MLRSIFSQKAFTKNTWIVFACFFGTHCIIIKSVKKSKQFPISYKHALMNPVLVTLFLTSFSSPLSLVLLLLLSAFINHKDLTKQRSKEFAEFGFLFQLT